MAAFDFSGKVCLVTGGASGMGASFAQAFARAGAKVYIADINTTLAEETVRQIQSEGYTAEAIALDATNDESVANLALRLKDDVPDILVNSIGVGAKAREGDDQLSLWNHVININLNGIYRCCMAVGNLMVDRGSGTIVNIASMSASIVPEKTRPGRLGENGLMAYCASKAGVRHLSRAIATLWAGYGIRANSVSPGYVDTPLTAEPHSDPVIRAQMESKVPLKKIASVDDITDTVLFMASPMSAYITGQDIIIDGGYTSL